MSNSSSDRSHGAPHADRRGGDREYAFSDRDFDDLRRRVKSLTGINLGDSKRELVYGRLSRRLRVLGLKSFADYRRLLENDNSPELGNFCNALTTNLTSFFREAHHFSHLRDTVLAPTRTASGKRRLRVWSAACSSGEEPYSVAITLCETLQNITKCDVKILATDVDSSMVATAERGIYRADRLKGMSAQRLERFFKAGQDASGPIYEVRPELRSLISFRQLNLMHELPMKGPLDAIFCRNVVIYFDKPTQSALFSRIAPLQSEGDLLYLGHSESLFNISDDYSLIGKTIYKRRPHEHS